MTGILQALLMGRGAAAAATDADFEYVTMLLPGNGTNGAQNNTFLDSSTNNFTITRNGNTTQGTFTPYGDNWSNYFDGTGDYLTAPSNTAFALGTGDFTVECWFYLNVMQDSAFWGIGTSTTSGGVMFRLENPGTSFNFYNNGDNLFTGSGISANTWYHLAVVRSSGTLKVYVNGTQYGSSLSNSTNIAQDIFYIGSAKVGSTVPYNPINGYISNIRVLKGTAQYTANFTPPTAPLTAVTNTQLLTCQSNRFIDNSTNAFTITRNGDVSVQRFSPFSPTAAYASGTIGGSGYFDGTGDYLQIAGGTNAALGSGNFTVECWINPSTVAPNYQIFYDDRSGSTNGPNITIMTASNALSVFSNNAFVINGGTILPNAWSHVAVVKSGSTLTAYLNGVSVGSASDTVTYTCASDRPIIGCSSFGINTFNYICYISNFRLVFGTAVYTSGFTPPTSPVTAITNTALLTNFTNAGIIDNAMMNDLETVGNAQISTSVSKFGGGSMYFDETGDYLTVPSTQNVAFGTGNFTIECWVRFATSTVGNGQGVFQLSNGYLNSAVRGPAVGTDDTSGKWAIYYGTSSSVHATSIPSTNTWYHVAFVRNSSTSKLYIDGTELISVSDSTNYTDTNFTIGGWYSSSYLLNGYIDDLRITKGVARYTANFTAPTAAFPTS